MDVKTETKITLTITLQDKEVETLQRILQVYLIQNVMGGTKKQSDEVVLAQKLLSQI